MTFLKKNKLLEQHCYFYFVTYTYMYYIVYVYVLVYCICDYLCKLNLINFKFKISQSIIYV